MVILRQYLISHPMIFSLPLIILVLWFQSCCCVTHSHITKEKAHSYLFSWSFFLGQFCWHLLMTIKNIICSCIISTSQKHFRRSKDLLLRRKHSKITRTWEISLSTCSDILMSSKTVNGWLIQECCTQIQSSSSIKIGRRLTYINICHESM